MNIFKNLSLKNKILVIATIILLLLVVPLTIMQSLNRQTTKQRASNDSHGFSIALASTGVTRNVGEDFEVEIQLFNWRRRDVSAVDMSYRYGGANPNLFESITFQPSSEFIQVVNDNGRYVGIVFPDEHRNAPYVTLGIVKFVNSKEAGIFSLDIRNISVNIAGRRDAIALKPLGGSYRIETAKASSNTTGGGIILSNPTPTSILIQTPTVTLTPTLIPTATPIPTNSSSDIDYNACLVSCNDLEDTTDALSCIQNCKTQYGK